LSAGAPGCLSHATGCMPAPAEDGVMSEQTVISAMADSTQA
jgi:hypothetical protein